MSLILYQGNNLVVEGEISEPYFLEGESGRKESCIDIRFIIQINGQMRVFQHSFFLSHGEEKEQEFSHGWRLKDWSAWYTLQSLFKSLGYRLSDDVGDEGWESNTVLLSWIERLLK